MASLKKTAIRQFCSAVIGFLMLAIAVYVHYSSIVGELSTVVLSGKIVCDNTTELLLLHMRGSPSIIVKVICLPQGLEANKTVQGVFVCPQDSRGVKVEATTWTGFPRIEAVYSCAFSHEAT
jgi:hypothetical protein